MHRLFPQCHTNNYAVVVIEIYEVLGIKAELVWVFDYREMIHFSIFKNNV